MNIIERVKSWSKIKKIIALALAGTITIGAGGTYGFLTAKKLKESDFELGNNVSYENSLDLIAKSSKIDDIIITDDITKLNNENNTLKLGETLYNYEYARVNEKMYELNNSLETLGLLTLKSAIVDALDIKLENIKELKIISDSECFIRYDKEVSKLVVGNIIDTDIIEEEKTIKLKGLAKEVIEIINNAEAHLYNSEEEVDNAYSKIIKFLYTKSSIKDNLLFKDSINFSYDESKIKLLKK